MIFKLFEMPVRQLEKIIDFKCDTREETEWNKSISQEGVLKMIVAPFISALPVYCIDPMTNDGRDTIH
jgi:hypothetical protein